MKSKCIHKEAVLSVEADFINRLKDRRFSNLKFVRVFHLFRPYCMSHPSPYLIALIIFGKEYISFEATHCVIFFAFFL
jgi:hypothetical protein